MINIEETLAAVDACQSVCDLPIICTVTVEADGNIFSGGNAVEAAMSLEAAGASAVGINCSVGPDQLVSVVRNIKENVSIPVIAKPNAGMPQIDDLGNAVYSMTPADFAGYMKVLVEKRSFCNRRMLWYHTGIYFGNCPGAWTSITVLQLFCYE